MIQLDTHVVAWLYAGALERIPAGAQALLEAEALAVSPVVGLELQYLHEVQRIRQPAEAVLVDLDHRLGLATVEASLAAVARQARALSWTRDPFDRLIAAHAVASDTPLLTADTTIRANLELAVWS